MLRAAFGWRKLSHAASDKGDGVWSLLRKGVDPRSEGELTEWSPNLYSPSLRRRLEADCGPVCAGTVSDSSIASDGTQKLLLRLEDGLAVECVLIPMVGGKTTSLCISSQVGCSRGCTFCSTGTMGLLRNLRAEEILAQVWLALRTIRQRRLPPLVNVVFMGMGEPLNNLDEVRRAVELLVHPKAFALSARCVCVSTVGPSPAHIRRAAEALPCRLPGPQGVNSVSSHPLLWTGAALPACLVCARGGRRAAQDAGADDTPLDGRAARRLPRIARHQAREVARAGRRARAARRRQRLAGARGAEKRPDTRREDRAKQISHSQAHAEQLAALLHPFGRGMVLANLIPYNYNGLVHRTGRMLRV